jgi:hypothetical protein
MLISFATVNFFQDGTNILGMQVKLETDSDEMNFLNWKRSGYPNRNKFLCKVCHPLGYKGHKTNVSGLTLIRIVFNKKE